MWRQIIQNNITKKHKIHNCKNNNTDIWVVIEDDKKYADEVQQTWELYDFETFNLSHKNLFFYKILFFKMSKFTENLSIITPLVVTCFIGFTCFSSVGCCFNCCNNFNSCRYWNNCWWWWIISCFLFLFFTEHE